MAKCITLLHSRAESLNVNIKRTRWGIQMKRKSRKFGPRVTVSVTGSDYKTLNALADKEDVSLSWVVRRAIDEYLRNHEREVRVSASAAGRSKQQVSAAG